MDWQRIGRWEGARPVFQLQDVRLPAVLVPRVLQVPSIQLPACPSTVVFHAGRARRKSLSRSARTNDHGTTTSAFPLFHPLVTQSSSLRRGPRRDAQVTKRRTNKRVYLLNKTGFLCCSARESEPTTTTTTTTTIIRPRVCGLETRFQDRWNSSPIRLLSADPAPPRRTFHSPIVKVSRLCAKNLFYAQI